MSSDVEKRFMEAAKLAAEGFYSEAAPQFEAASEAGDQALADDCLVNAAICYMNLGQYERALGLFQKEIREFPGSTLDNALSPTEHGETSAKSHLGSLQCYLALGRLEEAQAELDALSAFDETSWVDLPEGGRTTFRRIGEDLLEATGMEEDEADVVGPEDVKE